MMAISWSTCAAIGAQCAAAAGASPPPAGPNLTPTPRWPVGSWACHGPEPPFGTPRPCTAVTAPLRARAGRSHMLSQEWNALEPRPSCQTAATTWAYCKLQCANTAMQVGGWAPMTCAQDHQREIHPERPGRHRESRMSDIARPMNSE